jgi:hypothetical protein
MAFAHRLLLVGALCVLLPVTSVALSPLPGESPLPGKPSTSLPDFSWDTLPVYAHCANHSGLQEWEFDALAQFPLYTIEKFMSQEVEPVNAQAEAKILDAAAQIRARNTTTKILFYPMVWQDFAQYDLHAAVAAHANESWLVTCDNGSLASGAFYNHSNPDLRAAWVSTLASALATGLVDGFFLDITPSAYVNPYTGANVSIRSLCATDCCSDQRNYGLLASLEGSFAALRRCGGK